MTIECDGFSKEEKTQIARLAQLMNVKFRTIQKWRTILKTMAMRARHIHNEDKNARNAMGAVSIAGKGFL